LVSTTEGTGSSPRHGKGQPVSKRAPVPESRSRRSREETTGAILDAAEDLFSRRDPSQVTVREIAEKAGVTHPLVHQYVGSKKEVLAAVVKRGAPYRQEIMSAHPDFQEAMPLLFDDVLTHRVHTRSIVRSAMDGVEYAPFEDRLKSGQMLLELARKATEQGLKRRRPLEVVDPRVALAASVALAYGWVATQDWLVQIFDLEEADATEVEAQIKAILMNVADLIFPLEKDGVLGDGGDPPADSV
jgi:AcrR family transcriptional regulator